MNEYLPIDPNADELDRRIASLSPAKRAILEQKLKSRLPAANRSSAILPRPDAGQAPLSFAQARLWFLDRYEPESAFYNISWALKLDGILNRRALSCALADIVARHQVLRTVFQIVGDAPAQLIRPATDFKLDLVDLPHLPVAARATEALHIADREVSRPFDLAQGPLLRASLIRIDDREHLLVLNVHHIVSDGWSQAIFDRELSMLYRARLAGIPANVPELPIQYADYALWQRATLEGEILAAQLAYWRMHLEGAPPLLELPTDRARPPLQSFKGARQTRVIDRDLLAGIKVIGQAHKATLFIGLLTAFSALLCRYTRAADIVIGSPIAGRTRTETENLIGFFVNTLVLRIDCSGDPTFTELLSRAREVALGAYAHQDMPFEKLVEELKPTRSLSYSPLFQVVFALQNIVQEPVALSGLKVEPVSLSRNTAKFDLSVFASESPEGLRLVFEYNSDLFDQATIARMGGHYEALLGGAVADPGQKLSALPLLTSAERRTLLIDWNRTETAYPENKTIQALFEEQVSATPASVALIFKETTLTYAELNARANRMAHHLIALGAGPDALIGVCLERSIELIVSLIAIVKAGAAYLPLDPAYPAERLAFMLKDAQAPILITEPRLVACLPDHHATLVLVGSSSSDAASNPASDLWDYLPAINPTPQVTPDDLAYVIYTSGSTGRPKGVAVPQRGVVRLVKNTDYADFGREQVFLQFAPVSFDASTFEIWGPLLNGARLAIFPPYTPSLTQLARALEQYRITTLWLTASLFHLMVDDHLAQLAGLRQLLAGGDVLSVAHVNRFLSAPGDCRLINGYGPTESTTFACCHTVPRTTHSASIAIGRPISNTRVYILDDRMQPVPIGVAGELHIGGDGLARGYLGRPELTAARFVDFSAAEDKRLYRTGDLARYRPDGNIEFLGRIDDQTKIRGFRIEPGEIEAVLGRHPEIREVAVIARQDASGDKRLVAYVVAHGTPPEIGEVRRFLQSALPDYMLPSALVVLDKLPITENGKLDRGALPAPKQDPTSDAAPRAPRNPFEAELARLWERLLGLDTVSVTSNFFDLGGHSLLVVRLVAEIEKLCGKQLSVARLFQSPTIEQLARVLSADTPLDVWKLLVPINPGGALLRSAPPLFSAHIGAATELRDLGRHLGVGIAFYGINSQCLDPKRSPLRSVEEMAADNLQEVRAVQPLGPYYLAGYCAAGVVAFEMAQQLRAQGEAVALLVLFDAPLPKAASMLAGRLSTLRRHLRNLAKLDRRQQSRYVWTRLIDRSREAANRIAFRFVSFCGLPLPEAVLSQYILDIYTRARRDYTPRIYPGKLTLIWATDNPLVTSREARAGWSRLSTLAAENFDIAVDHQTMFKEPQVALVAEQLKLCVADARGAPAWPNVKTGQRAPTE